MKVSGFTFVRNAVDLYYPVVESIRSILPICDEFVVAAGDSTDGTTALLRSIGDAKLKIIETRWDPKLFVAGAIFAQQTDVALQACSGDWAFYIQADEVVHERDLPVIRERMQQHLDNRAVDGLLFDYLHFFGDYDHVQSSHNWYGYEIRIVRTCIGVQSWHDAQGFRRHGEKLRVAHAGGCIYHYGWVRPPRNLNRKLHSFHAAYHGAPARDAPPVNEVSTYNYGRLRGLRPFRGTHPAVMQARVRQQDWEVHRTAPNGFKHDRIGVQLLTLLENYVLGFRVGERRNYKLLPGTPPARWPTKWRQRLARHASAGDP